MNRLCPPSVFTRAQKVFRQFRLSAVSGIGKAQSRRRLSRQRIICTMSNAKDADSCRTRPDKPEEGLKICVFCGSSTGSNDVYSQAARSLADVLSKRKIALVYGGGSLGLMGVISQRMIENSGESSVTGVIPEFFIAYAQGLVGNTTVVKSMDERKSVMMDISDAFVVLPGSCGTLEEFFSALSLHILGMGKPIGLLNVNHFYDKLLDCLDHVSAEGFLKPDKRRLLAVSDDPDDLVQKLLDEMIQLKNEKAANPC